MLLIKLFRRAVYSLAVLAAIAGIVALSGCGKFIQPGQDTPGTDTPGNETPGENTPGQDIPGTDDPGEEPDEPGTDTPAGKPRNPIPHQSQAGLRCYLETKRSFIRVKPASLLCPLKATICFRCFATLSFH